MRVGGGAHDGGGGSGGSGGGATSRLSSASRARAPSVSPYEEAHFSPLRAAPTYNVNARRSVVQQAQQQQNEAARRRASAANAPPTAVPLHDSYAALAPTALQRVSQHYTRTGADMSVARRSQANTQTSAATPQQRYVDAPSTTSAPQKHTYTQPEAAARYEQLTLKSKFSTTKHNATPVQPKKSEPKYF